MGLDFSDIDCQDKVPPLVDAGVLEALHLLPQEFGGREVPENRLYVPAGNAYLKRRHDLNVILPLVNEGLLKEYYAAPTYEGRSVIPTSIFVHAWDPRDVRWTLAIWGEALEEDLARQQAADSSPAESKRRWWRFW